MNKIKCNKLTSVPKLPFVECILDWWEVEASFMLAVFFCSLGLYKVELLPSRLNLLLFCLAFVIFIDPFFLLSCFAKRNIPIFINGRAIRCCIEFKKVRWKCEILNLKRIHFVRTILTIIIIFLAALPTTQL